MTAPQDSTGKLPRSVELKIATAFLAGLVYLAILGGIAYRSVLQYAGSRAQVDRTYAILRSLDSTMILLASAEASGRGFVITGDEQQLASYRAARAAIPARLAVLRTLTGADSVQRRRLERIQPLIARRLDILGDVEAARRARGVPAPAKGAAALGLASRGGAVLSDTIRVLVDSMADEETALLRARQRRERDGIGQSLTLITIGFLAAMALSALATLVLRRYIAERVKAEEEARDARDAAEAANRSKSDFLARMSHELRTPLNSVIGFSNVLLKNRDGSIGPQQLSYLDRILAGGKQLLALINDVLDLSKIEAGRMQLERIPVDLDTLIPDIIASFEGHLRGRDVELGASVPEHMAPLVTDPGRLQQVITNLIGNAIKFTERGYVTLRVRIAPETRAPVRIDVSDTGVGIPEDRLEAIFEVFEQADISTTRRYGGTGLGLPISRSLCRLMGYDLRVTSTVGRGSTFSIVLDPSAPPALGDRAGDAVRQTPRSAEAVTAGDGRSAELPGCLVLVVDDEHDSRTLLSHYVEELGCRVVPAESAAEGMQLAREHSPDLILLDLLMPGMSGWEALREIKADSVLRDIPVVVVSIVAREHRGAVLGAMDLIDKPVAREDVHAALRRNLRARRGRVLVVENDGAARDLIAGYLREAGEVEIRTAADGRDALASLGEWVPDLVVLDLLLLGMEGPAFLERLRADPRYLALPVVVVTSRELSPTELSSLKATTQGVLAKGASLSEDLRRVLTTIWKPRLKPEVGGSSH